MIFRSLLRRRRIAVLLVSLVLCLRSIAAVEDSFKTPASLSTEAMWLIKVLEGAHYSRLSVHPSDYSEVIPDYMAALDGQHLFFVASDKEKFTRQYNGDTVYSNVAYLGNIDPAYEVYRVYEQRVRARIAWITAALKQPIDLATNQTYGIDRTKSEWPATAADSDDLWLRRARVFGLVRELLDGD